MQTRLVPLGGLLVLVGNVGCYASHVVPLAGERYHCVCQYEVRIPCGDLGATLPIGDDPEPEIECSSEEYFSWKELKPCRVDEHEPEAVCALECASKAPPLATSVTTSVSGSPGPGLCTDDEGFYWTYPEVPQEAIRNGTVIPEASRFSIHISGPDVDASSGDLVPDPTIVSMSGASCAGSGVGPCEGIVRDGRLETGPFSIDDHTASGMWMQFSNQWPMSVQAGSPSPWQFTLGSEAPTVEFEIFGVEGLGDLTTIPGSFEWDDASLGGDIDLARGTVDKHMTISGTATGQLVTDSGDTYQATLEGTFYVRFISGAPLPEGTVGRMPGSLTDAGGSDPPIVVLDGRDSWDELGAGIVDYAWIAYVPERPEGPVLVGTEALLQIPLVHWVELVDEGVDPMTGESRFGEVCLRVTDGDGMHDEVCFGPGFVPAVSSPPPPTLDCMEAWRGLPYASKFAQLVDSTDVAQYAAARAKATWIVPADAAIPDQLFQMLMLPQMATLRHDFVANHLYDVSVELDYLGLLDLLQPVSGVDVNSDGIEADILVQGLPCGTTGQVHISRRILAPLPDDDDGGGGVPFPPGGGGGPGCGALGC